MVGRGALGNPWIFGEHNRDGSFYVLPSPCLLDKAAMFLRHAQLTAEDKGEHIAVLEMRKHAGWYFKGVKGSARLRASVNKAATLDALIEEINAFTSETVSK